MFFVEKIPWGPPSKNKSVGVESIVAGLGTRTSSFCGIRMSQEETPQLSGFFRSRVTALSLNDPIQNFQLVDSQAEEVLAEREQGPTQIVRVLQAKIFADSVMSQRPQTICVMSHGGNL